MANLDAEELALRLRQWQQEMLGVVDESQTLNSLYRAAGALTPPVGTVLDFYTDETARVYRGIRELMERDRLPLPDFLTRDRYGSTHLAYWLYGLEHYLEVIGACARHGIVFRRTLDFGASSGRIFRHFYSQDRAVEAWGCDFNKVTVDWCLKYFPSDAHFFMNTYLPHLPIPNGFFDLVTAYSVFTHIDALESAWLLEIHRILQKGGAAYVTFLDEHSWDAWEPRAWPAGRRSIYIATDFGGKLVGRRPFRFSHDDHYNCDIFHHTEYIREIWGAFFEIAEIVPGDGTKQAKALFIKR